MSRHNELGDIRRTQVVTTFGPGSIIDFRAGKNRNAAISVVATGLETWEQINQTIQEATKVYEPRLQSLLKTNHFRLAPVAPQASNKFQKLPDVFLEGRRFPLWQQCPKCHRVKKAGKWKSNPGDPAQICAPCSKDAEEDVTAVPVRFVIACMNGHIAEFPWEHWVHQKQPCSNPDLILESEGGAGLAALILSCKSCDARQSMDGIFGKEALQDRSIKCRGQRPWLDDHEPCDLFPRVLQRGASNLYFSDFASALDIPPWSDGIHKLLGRDWDVLVKAEDEQERKMTMRSLNRSHNYTERLGLTEEQILEAIEQRQSLLESVSPESIRREEHMQFISDPSKNEHSVGSEFEIRPKAIPERFDRIIGHLVEVRRLREVRALKGFSRIMAITSGDESRQLSPLSRDKKNWLPAVEIRGEGIYVELHHDALREWESTHRTTLIERSKKLQADYERSWANEGSPPERPLSPRFLLVHSLAHAMLRQLSLDCGYSSASLRERLYIEDDEHEMAGFLIYTGSSDADGTLGGLSRQADPRRFEALLDGAIQSMVWCSNDPLCIEGHASTSEPLNGAACHACMLAAETSCEEWNQLLDRSTLVGTPQQRNTGFFSDYLKRTR